MLPNQLSAIRMRPFPANGTVNRSVVAVVAPHSCTHYLELMASADSTNSAPTIMPLDVSQMVFNIIPRGVGFLGMYVKWALPWPTQKTIVSSAVR